jgi:hypothetical protein
MKFFVPLTPFLRLTCAGDDSPLSMLDSFIGSMLNKPKDDVGLLEYQDAEHK